MGKSRYGLPRPCYPPGEVALKFPMGDPRKDLFTAVNMTAVGSGQMTAHATATVAASTTATGTVAVAATGIVVGENTVSCDDDTAPSASATATAVHVDSSPVHWIYHR